VKPPRPSLPEPIAYGAEVTPTNLLSFVQATDELRANNLLNQATGDQSHHENHDAGKLGGMHKLILVAAAAEKIAVAKRVATLCPASGLLREGGRIDIDHTINFQLVRNTASESRRARRRGKYIDRYLFW